MWSKRDILTPKLFSFIEVFQETAKKIQEKAASEGEIEWLLQGTLYPDVIESIQFTGKKPHYLPSDKLLFGLAPAFE